MAHISIQIVEDAGLALVAIGEAVTGPDIVEAAHRLHAHPRWSTRHDVIWDARTITSLDLVPRDMSEMVEAKVEDSTGREITIVTRKLDEVAAHLCAVLVRARGREATVVHSFDEALAALGLDGLPDALTEAAE